jgi:hypothetical protein
MYETRKMRSVETILRMRVGIKKNDEGVNITNIYCKHFCKYHDVPPVQH